MEKKGIKFTRILIYILMMLFVIVIVMVEVYLLIPKNFSIYSRNNIFPKTRCNNNEVLSWNGKNLVCISLGKFQNVSFNGTVGVASGTTPIYEILNQFCDNYGLLTTLPLCSSSGCTDLIGNPLYFDCNGNCAKVNSTNCSNTDSGLRAT